MNKTKQQLLEEMDQIHSKSDIRDVLKLISEYSELSPMYYTEINSMYRPVLGPRYDIIRQALKIHETHKRSGISLERLIENYNKHLEQQRLMKTNLAPDYGLTEIKSQSNLVKRVAQVIDHIKYVIPRAYSNSDPRLFVLGYGQKDLEMLYVRDVAKAVNDSEKDTIAAVDDRSFYIHVLDEEIKKINIDDRRLILAEKANREKKIHLSMAEHRLYQAAIPKLFKTMLDNPNSIVLAILGYDLSLYKHHLYRALEKNKVPYVSIFPGPNIFRQPTSKDLHRKRLNELAEADFTDF